MSEKAESFLSPFSKQAAQFSWLTIDVFLLILILLFFTFYRDLEGYNLRNLFSLYIVFSIGYFMLSGLHLLAYHRHDDLQAINKNKDYEYRYQQFPALCSYTLYGLKFIWFTAFLVIAIYRNLIPVLA